MMIKGYVLKAVQMMIILDESWKSMDE